MNLSQNFQSTFLALGFWQRRSLALVAQGYNVQGFISNTEASSEIDNVRSIDG